VAKKTLMFSSSSPDLRVVLAAVVDHVTTTITETDTPVRAGLAHTIEGWFSERYVAIMRAHLVCCAVFVGMFAGLAACGGANTARATAPEPTPAPRSAPPLTQAELSRLMSAPATNANAAPTRPSESIVLGDASLFAARGGGGGGNGAGGARGGGNASQQVARPDMFAADAKANAAQLRGYTLPPLPLPQVHPPGPGSR
jgi:hypothetical protein